MYGKHKLILAMVIAAPLSFGPGIASTEEANTIEEIVVTATKRSVAVSDVPLEIDALSQELLVNANVEDIRYLIGASPKLKAMANFGQFATVITSRGLIGSTNLDPTVGTYIDDLPFVVPAGGWAPSGALFDLARVEVLGGPQGTLYGQGSLAGTVRIITNDPNTEKAEAALEVGYATVADGDDDQNYAGMLNLPIVKDKLAARVVYSKREEGGFIDAVDPSFAPLGLYNKDDYNWADYEDFRLKVLATPTDRLTLKGTYWQSESVSINADAEFGGVFALLGFGAAPRETANWFQDGDNRSETKAWSLFAEYDFGPVTVSNSYSDLDFDILQDTFSLGSIGAAIQPVEGKSNELRITSNLERPFQFVAGHYYYDGTNQFDVDIVLDPLGFGGGPFPLGGNRLRIDSEVSAFFAELSYEFLDGDVVITVGLRDFEDDRTFAQAVSFESVPLAQKTFVISERQSETFSKTTTRFNIAWRPMDDQDWLVFLNVGEGFRSGNFNAQISRDGAAGAGFPGDVRFVQPDVNQSWDLGTKFTSANGVFSADVTAFWATLEDAQQSVDFTLGAVLFAATLVNAGDLDVFGIDYSITISPTDNLSFNLQGSYLDTEWDTLAPLIDQFSSLRVGGPALGVPENQVIASTTFTQPFGWFGGVDFIAYLDYRYESESSDTTGVPGNDTPSHEKWNLRLTLAKADSWSASMYVDNLTDEDKWISSAFNGFNTPPRPRQIGVTFRKDFTF